jgi:hypothetical protein
MDEIYYTTPAVQDFLEHFKIVDVNFYTSPNETKGYIKIQVEEEVFECDFELEEHLTLMKKIIVRKTNKSYSLELFLGKIFAILPENKKDYELYPVISEVFNEYFLYKIEGKITKEIGKKLRKEACVTFTKFKSINNEEFLIHCNFTIFDKEFKFHFTKATEYTSLQIDGGGNVNDYTEWFLKEIVKNEYNEKNSSFYVDNAIDHFYGIISILGEIISLEFKDTKHYRMSILYDNELKELFE